MKLIVRHDARNLEVEVERYGSGYHIKLDGRVIEAGVTRANLFLSSLCFNDGRQFLVGHQRDGHHHAISFGDQTLHIEVFDPLSLKRRRRDDEGLADAGTVKALMPGRVIRVLAEEGAQIEKGKGLLILEAMKMENEITASVSGTVTKLFVKAGDTVDSGADLAIIE